MRKRWAVPKPGSTDLMRTTLREVGSTRAIVAKLVMELGYTELRADGTTGVTVVASDEGGVTSLVIVDVTASTDEDGYPVARLSDGRRRGLALACEAYLADHAGHDAVRGDYIALPCVLESGARTRVTLTRGAAWAHKVA